MAFFGLFKSRDYGKTERPQGRRSVGGMFSTGGLSTTWTDEENFASRTKQLLYGCPVSRRCFDIRAEKLASITLKVENASKRTRKVLKSPNFRDRTMSNLLKIIETDLALGGDAWLWLNVDVRDRPILEALRPDFMYQEPDKNRILYDPSKRLTGTSKPELIFTMDPDEFSRTQMVERISDNGRSSEIVEGALLQISIYNPLSALQGSGAGDAILADIATYRAATKLKYARFANGGRKAGWITLPDMDGLDDMTDEDWSKLQQTMERLRNDDELKGLVAGSNFIENQMTFAELDVVEVEKALERRIAMALGVQPVMLGFENETTGMNMRTADRTFYTGWLKPRADFILGHLQSFISEELGDKNLEISIDETKLPYLQEDKLEKMSKIAQFGAVTPNELREQADLAHVSWGNEPVKVAGASDHESKPDREPQPQPDNSNPREVGHNADTSRRADQRG